MLVDKKLQDDTTVSIKLITGEEIIARKVSVDGDQVTIANPLAMVLADNPDNPQQTRVMFTPWMIAAATERVVLQKSHIVFMVAARPEAAEQYQSAITD